MGRYGRKRKNTALRRCVVWGLLAAAAVPGVLSTAVLYDHARQTLGGFVTDTAVFSALYSEIALPNEYFAVNLRLCLEA